MSRAKASRLRQVLRENEDARRQHVNVILGTEAVIVGSLVRHGRRCGKPNCRCATGEKHFSRALSRNEDGSVRHIHVPAGDEVEVALKTDRYRKLREARAELVKLAGQTSTLVDELQMALTEPYPPPNRAPGRRRKGKASGGRRR